MQNAQRHNTGMHWPRQAKPAASSAFPPMAQDGSRPSPRRSACLPSGRGKKPLVSGCLQQSVACPST